MPKPGLIARYMRLVFGPFFYVVEYEAKDIIDFMEQPPLQRTCIGGAEKFGGCATTGVFRHKRSAEKFMAHILATYHGEWPLVPVILDTITEDDERVQLSTWRNHGQDHRPHQEVRTAGYRLLHWSQ